MAKNKFAGPISSNESRMTLKWFTDGITVPDSDKPGPGSTLDSQWDIGTKKLNLYNITSKPWHNMQDVTFICEFDSTTNLAPNPGGTDPSESPETDPLEFIGPNKPAIYSQETLGTVISNNTFNIGTLKMRENIPFVNLPSLAPTIDTNSGLYVVQYWLRIMNSGSNQGYYPIISNTNGIIQIDPLDKYGELTEESNLNARVYRFKRGDGTSVANNNNDIQIDLQSGKYHAHVFIHSWPSYWNSNKLHTFKITPYYLTKSELDSSGVIPIWSFQCKSVVQEIDQINYGAKFENYWGNFEPEFTAE